MSDVSIAEAKTHLTRIMKRVETGEAIRITRRGKPVAVLVSQEEHERNRRELQTFPESIERTAIAAGFVVKRFGNGLLLLPTHSPWTIMREALDDFEPDLKLEREQPEQQERAAWAR